MIVHSLRMPTVTTHAIGAWCALVHDGFTFKMHGGNRFIINSLSVQNNTIMRRKETEFTIITIMQA